MLAEQQRLLAPDRLGPHVPTAVPQPAAEPELESVDITVVDDSDWVGKIAGLVRRGEIKDFSNVAEMVDRVLARAAGRKIGVLHIYDHGAPGYQTIGDQWVGLDRSPEVFAELARLAGHFASDGQVVLHGCQAAQGPRGPQLLAFLAQTWRVPVQASEVIQRPGIPGRGLQGSTVECSPEAGDAWLDEVGQIGSMDVDPDCDREQGRMDGMLDRDYARDLAKLNPWKQMKKLKFW